VKYIIEIERPTCQSKTKTHANYDYI